MQNIDKYNVLVLGPGGNKGCVELGALEYVEMTQRLGRLDVIVGVSIGAIIGLLKVCGYNAASILEYAISTNMLDMSNLIPSMSQILVHQGIFSNISFEHKLTDYVKAKFGFVPTLLQLYNATGILYTTVVTNVTVTKDHPIQMPEYFNYKTEPHLSCVTAALMSANIPGLFSKTEYKNGIYVDGALGNPYPVDIYDNPGNNILGISIISLPFSGGKNMVDYMVQSINAPISQLRERIKGAASNRVTHLFIQIEMNDALGFMADENLKKEMFILGFKSAKDFYEKGAYEGLYMRETDQPVFD